MKRTIAKYAFIVTVSGSLLVLPNARTSLAHQQPPPLDKVFKEFVGLNDIQIDEIHRGKALAKVMDSSTPDQVMVFGTVYIESSSEKYLQFANDFDTLRKLPGYLAIQKFPSNPTYAVALKQLYASHYFQSALDLSVCMRDVARPNERGFYLITVKGSQQAGLTGIKGGIVRKVAVNKSRAALENTLTAMKQKLEADPR